MRPFDGWSVDAQPLVCEDICGPMDGPLSRGRLKFFREAPRLGLTGISFITIGEHGVIAESVAYDLNLALAVHQRRAPTEQL